SSGPFSADMQAALRRLCAEHSQSKQLRLYAALERLEQHDSHGALLVILTAPYLRPPSPEWHYEALDTAALGQALAVDERAARSALSTIRQKVRRWLNT